MISWKRPSRYIFGTRAPLSLSANVWRLDPVKVPRFSITRTGARSRYGFVNQKYFSFAMSQSISFHFVARSMRNVRSNRRRFPRGTKSHVGSRTPLSRTIWMTCFSPHSHSAITWNKPVLLRIVSRRLDIEVVQRQPEPVPDPNEERGEP